MRTVVNVISLALLTVAAADASASAAVVRTDVTSCSYFCTETCPTDEQHQSLCQILYPGCNSFTKCAPYVEGNCPGGFESTCWPGGDW